MALNKAIDKDYLKRQFKNFDTNVLESKYLQEADLTIKKSDVADSGYASTYKLVFKSGTSDEKVLGDSINIPKDYFLTDAAVKTCNVDDNPVVGYKIGDKYLDLLVNVDAGGSSDEKHLYVLVSDMIQSLKAGVAIEFTGDDLNEISVKYGSNLEIGSSGEDAGKLVVKFESNDIDFYDWDTYTV